MTKSEINKSIEYITKLWPVTPPDEINTAITVLEMEKRRLSEEPYRCIHGHADELDCPVCGH